MGFSVTLLNYADIGEKVLLSRYALDNIKLIYRKEKDMFERVKRKTDELGQNISPTVIMIAIGVGLAILLFTGVIGKPTLGLGEQAGNQISKVIGDKEKPKDEYTKDWYAWVSTDGKTLHCTVEKPSPDNCLGGTIA